MSKAGTKATTIPYKAVWRAKDGDIPVIVIGDLGEQSDGRRYLRVEDYAGAVLADEIFQPSDPRLDAALDYMRKGWTPIPIPMKEKNPGFKGWQKYQAQNGQIEKDFHGAGNIGLLLGAPSKGLVDIDLDWEEGCALAAKFLPATKMKSGRDTAPFSHWWFTCENAKTEKWVDPNKAKDDARAMIVELRSTGAQTVVAPSTHPSGESCRWHGSLQPTEVEHAALKKAVGRLAACALIARYWPNGTRHDAALALAGALLRNGWMLAEADNFIVSAARVANDDELDDRAKAIVSTDEKLKAGESVTGIPKLVEIFGKNTVDKLVKWLDLRPVTREQTPAQGEEKEKETATPGVVAHSLVLERILANLQPCDFYALGGFQPQSEIKQKHYVVLCIRQLLEVVKKQNFALARKNDFIFVYNGEYWREIDRDTLKDFLGNAAEKLGVISIEAHHYEFKDKLWKQFLAAAHFDQGEPENGKALVNLKNGTFEITADSQELRAFNAADFLKYQLPFDYNKEAKAPIFTAYLNRVLPEIELQNIVAEFFGYVFTRRLKLEKALLLYGIGANGKSVLFDVMNALLGRENTANYSLSDLIQEHNRAQIAHKLLNYGSEINASVTKDVFKNLVSGEAIMARLKYGNSFLMEDYAKLCFNCNELPKDIEQTEAYFRRLLIVPFRIVIPESEQDKELAQKIIAGELSGVFNWVLAGLRRLLKNKRFTDSKIVEETLKDYKRESDSVACFLQDENWAEDPHNPDHTEPLRKLHMAYGSYCREAGYRPLGRNNFCKRLEANGILRKAGGAAQHFYISHQGEPA